MHAPCYMQEYLDFFFSDSPPIEIHGRPKADGMGTYDLATNDWLINNMAHELSVANW